MYVYMYICIRIYIYIYINGTYVYTYIYIYIYIYVHSFIYLYNCLGVSAGATSPTASAARPQKAALCTPILPATKTVWAVSNGDISSNA